MGNKYRGIVDVDIDGTTMQLRYGINEIVALEDMRGGKSVSDMFGRDVGIGVIRDALYVGLRWDKTRKLTVERVGEMMDPARLGHYAERIGEALKLALVGPSQADPQRAPAEHQGPSA